MSSLQVQHKSDKKLILLGATHTGQSVNTPEEPESFQVLIRPFEY